MPIPEGQVASVKITLTKEDLEKVLVIFEMYEYENSGDGVMEDFEKEFVRILKSRFEKGLVVLNKFIAKHEAQDDLPKTDS